MHGLFVPEVYRSFGKRVLDSFLAAGLLTVLSPLLGLTAILIWFEDGWPIIFAQERVGKDGRTFTLLKFRSMAKGSPSVASTEAQRLVVTRTGRFIRRANIDELPQLINVLRGEMSLVGPRPALPSQQDLISARRGTPALECLPGLTGLAQVRAYDGMPAAEKAAFDTQYAADISLRRDLTLLCQTVSYLKKPPPSY